jgi:hypothetical protein
MGRREFFLLPPIKIVSRQGGFSHLTSKYDRGQRDRRS